MITEPTLPDPTTVTSWPQAVVTIVMILAILVVPSVLSYLGNQRIKAVEKSLTTNNGGSHVKDQLDRIEESQGELRVEQATVATALGVLQGDVASLQASAARHHPDDPGRHSL